MTMPRSLLALIGVLALAACENLPWPQDAGQWFSDSEYDPEIDAIERDTPPPEEPFAPPGAGAMAPGAPGYLLAAAGVVVADPPEGMTIRLGAAPVASARDVVMADAPVAPSAGRLATLPDSANEPVGGAAPGVRPAATLTPAPDPPPLGWSRARRVIYGQNRLPFRPSPYRALR